MTAQGDEVQASQVQLFQGDCVAEMIMWLVAESVDAIVCDPPYGLGREPDMVEVLTHWLAGDDAKVGAGQTGFMGKTWDSFVPGPATWRQAYRVLKPGGYLVAFGGTKTVDLLTTAIGTTGEAARLENVSAILIEQDAIYAEIIRARLHGA